MTLSDELERLADAAEAARSIGLVDDADRANAVAARARERAGFPGDVYVLALAGGTGVGKSSLLNALAGRTVSAVRAVRPTTEEPIAWVGEARRGELAPLLAWMGVELLAAHTDDPLARVAILDLPDVDSVRTQHRATVDELLPRIDALAWVVDPEKYDDERLHEYLRSLSEHAARMRFVLNKADRLTADERTLLAGDLSRRLAASGIPAPTVHVVSASTGDGIAELRVELVRDAAAKGMVVAKLSTDVRHELDLLARAVGLQPGVAYAPILADARRAAAVREAVEGAVAVIDPPGLARQVQAGVVGRARTSGGSLLGRGVALLGWLTGHSRRTADPIAYVRDWRRRGSLGRVVNPIRSALVEASAGVPPATRTGLLGAVEADELEGAVADALDRVARDVTDDLRVPHSMLWSIVGVLQLAIGGVFLFAVAWYVTLFVAPGPVPVMVVETPLLGPLPLPLVLLAGSIVVSAILGMLLSMHAGWIGRRRGRRVADRVREAVAAAVESTGMARLDALESARRRIAG